MAWGGCWWQSHLWGASRAGASPPRPGFLQDSVWRWLGRESGVQVGTQTEAGRLRALCGGGPWCDSAFGMEGSDTGGGEKQAARSLAEHTQLTRPICSPNTRSSWLSAHLSWGREEWGVGGQKSVKGGSAEPYQGPNTPSQRCLSFLGTLVCWSAKWGLDTRSHLDDSGTRQGH